jgi:hypothetical protein
MSSIKGKVCVKCWASKHLPPDGDKDLWVGRNCRCACFPKEFCQQPMPTKFTNKDIDMLLNSAYGCMNCGQKFDPRCTDDKSPSLCRACIIYLPHYDPENELNQLAYKALNTLSLSLRKDDFYGPNNLKPSLNDLNGIDCYFKRFPRPPLNPKITNESGGVADDENQSESEGDSITKGAGDPIDEGGFGNTTVASERMAYRTPTGDQVDPFDHNEPIGKYSKLFHDIGAKVINEADRRAFVFDKSNFKRPVTVQFFNDVLKTYRPVDDTKRRGGKPSPTVRFFKQEGRMYNKLHKYDVLDGYANTQVTSEASIFGPCVISNPSTTYKYVWICLWRGECGKIVKHLLYDLQKHEIVTFEGTAFYRLYWNFSPEIPFNEEEVMQAYNVFSADKEHDPLRVPDIVNAETTPTVVLNESGIGKRNRKQTTIYTLEDNKENDAKRRAFYCYIFNPILKHLYRVGLERQSRKQVGERTKKTPTMTTTTNFLLEVRCRRLLD